MCRTKEPPQVAVEGRPGRRAEVEPSLDYYLQLSAGGILVAAGFHANATDQVDRYRAAVDAPRTGA